MERASALLEDNFAESPLGFKDPRTLLVLQGWKQVYPDIQFVGVLRHPNAVAQSLKMRGDMPADQALALWYTYNHALLKEFQRKPFPILCFDQEEAVFQQKIDRLANTLGLKQGANGQQFYDEQLRTSNSNRKQMEKALPWRLKRLYNRLLKHCL